jgi:hypothetical protein
MNLLKNINLSPFLRMVWANPRARQAWEKVINQLSSKIQELEIISVARDQRLCAWQTFPVRDFPRMTKKIIDLGLSLYPINLCGSWGQGFCHYTPSLSDTDPNPQVSCIITREPRFADRFWTAYNKGDHITQGELLGFPHCCTQAFTRNWKAGYFDPVWQMVETEGETSIYLEKNEYNIFSNPILRYIGIRVGFHIPCTFHCQETVDIAEERLELMDKESKLLLISLLRMPMQWSALNGIAVIKTPIFTMITQSVPCSQAHTINLRGDFYPLESAAGSGFPYTLEVAS